MNDKEFTKKCEEIMVALSVNQVRDSIAILECVKISIVHSVTYAKEATKDVY